MLTEKQRACSTPLKDKEPGSLPWCWQVVAGLAPLWDRKTLTAQLWHEKIALLKTHKAWEKIPPEQPYGSLDALLRAEIGPTEAEARQVLARQEIGKGKVGPGRGRKTDDVVSRFMHGNSAEYLEARLRRDYPDILTAWQRGKYPSARAAAKAAGIVRDKTPLQQLQHWWDKATAEERTQFRVWTEEARP